MNKNTICNNHLKLRRCKHESQANNEYHSRGPSSFAMHDPEIIFNSLNLQKGDTFLDLGCGSGDYSLQAARIVGESGKVFALDIWKSVISGLADRAKSQGLANVQAMVADITDALPVDDNSCEVCLIATVLHTMDIRKDSRLFSEVSRVLKPGGLLTIIECKKEGSFGPPQHLRLSPQDLENIISKFGFQRQAVLDLGHNYLIQFVSE